MHLRRVLILVAVVLGLAGLATVVSQPRRDRGGTTAPQPPAEPRAIPGPAGVPMLEAIEITGKTSGNKVIEMAMDNVHASVKKGGTLSAPMREVPSAFPVMVVQMIGVGEETGALEAMMTKIAEFYEDQVAAAVKALTSILEPVMILLVGAIVGFIVISMYLPMFKVYDAIK